MIESLTREVREQQREIQRLRDEVNRLKGEKGKPDILPSTDKSHDISSQKHTGQQKQWKKKPKKEIIKIDNTEHCPIDKTILPDDAQFKGYETVIGQDIIFKRNNTEYRIEIWYSPSQNKTYRSNLPASYNGYFGNSLKTFCITMHYALDVTRNTLITFLGSIGIEMSAGSLQNILTENSGTWMAEKNDLLKAGLHGPYLQTDSTGTRVHGQNQRTHVFVSEFFAVFSTQTGKSRLDILGALQGQPENGVFLQFNQIAIEFFDHYKISPIDRQAVEHIFMQQSIIGIKEFDLVAAEKLPALKKKTTTYKWVVESLAFGYYFEQTEYLAPSVLVTDDAKEYILLAIYRMLCWIHDARYYNKLTPLIDSHRKELEKFKDRYWGFYTITQKNFVFLAKFQVNFFKHKNSC
jgi:hypothetical protein